MYLQKQKHNMKENWLSKKKKIKGKWLGKRKRDVELVME